jgi:hypothetical protein
MARSVVHDKASRLHRLTPFGRHFLEMFGVMVVGMIVAAGFFLTIVGMTWDEATVEHPLGSLLVVATGMTLPMAAWMLHRGMGVRNATEMSAAMGVRVVPFLCLVWFGFSAQCGIYCLVAVATMVGLTRYRREEYSMEMRPA